jgi:ParB-like chromosome segregation protein Spo0J
MQIEQLPVDGLMPYARNSRTHSDAQVAVVADSIKRFGFVNPALIRQGTIIAGHGRLMAAKKLGLADVPCIRLDHMTEDEARAYVIADNRIAELAAQRWQQFTGLRAVRESDGLEFPELVN